MPKIRGVKPELWTDESFLEPERRTYYPSRRDAEVAALMHTAFGGE